METVLPLTNHEKKKYVEVASIQMLAPEMVKMWRKSFMLVMTSSYILAIMAADYSYFWFLSLIHFIGSMEKGFEDEGE
jgi:sterol desaturase/sphingolipid hydroxylase (fatty acid hydroxylase superfamily)